MTVYLVGAGPGDADLLTVRATKLLSQASVIVRDRLIDESVLSYASPEARIYNVGKLPGDSSSQSAINELLISLGRTHEVVVRLKGGDPFVFGRGGEELIALREASIDCDVVPGISSAFSGPLAAGIPVTHRGLSRGVTVVTGTGDDGEVNDLSGLARMNTTIVVLMGIKHRATIAADLIRGGLGGETPVAVVERAWSATQRTVRATLQDLATLRVDNPAVIVIGDVATLDLRSVVTQGRLVTA